MRRFSFLLAALPLVVSLFSCAKEEILDFSNQDCAQIQVSVIMGQDADGKAIFSDNGFKWQVGDVVSWTSSSGSQTSHTLVAADITDGNKAVFSASIPGLASADVNGYFSVNVKSDGTVPFSTGTLSNKILTVKQPEAGTINPSNFFLFSTKNWQTLKKGQTDVSLDMNIIGSIVGVRPFTAKYNSEKIQKVAISSGSDFCGDVSYNHNTGTASSIAGNAANQYVVRLTTAQSLSGITSKTAAKSVYFSVPSGSLSSFTITVTTDVAKYVSSSTSALTLKENSYVAIPINLDKATRTLLPTPAQLDLSTMTVSSNAPMQYVKESCSGGSINDTYGVGAPDWIVNIESSVATQREQKLGTASNMWDGNTSTSYVTNLDVWEDGGSWSIRSECKIANHYIQISGLGSDHNRLKIVATSDSKYGCFSSEGLRVKYSTDGTNFTDADGSPFSCASGVCTISEIEATGIKAIRLYKNSNPDWTEQGPAIGISELQIWDLDGTGGSGGGTDPQGIRPGGNPPTVYFLPRRWKTGMNVSTNSWYKYWCDPTNTWNTSNTSLWLPNCTHYCMGRAAEISQRPIFSNHELFNSGYSNAQNWYANAKWSKGSTPKLGAICVWSGGSYGHVATVEAINDDGTIDISQSSYQSTNRTYENSKYFEYWSDISCTVGSVTSRVGWTFVGYVYNPHTVDLRVSRNTNRSQIRVDATSIVVRNDNLVSTGLSVLPGIYNVYAIKKNAYAGYDYVKIANDAWIPVNKDGGWNELFY